MKAGPRIVAGAWRGRMLRAPEGQATRPTSVRLRQSVFDLLMHAPWFGRARMDGATVGDVFAGSGALGLEALSRGAARCAFVERDPAALAPLRANIAACGAGGRVTVFAGDACAGRPFAACDLLFLDPPYGAGLIAPAMIAARDAGWITGATVIVCEAEAALTLPGMRVLATRAHGAGCVTVFWCGGVGATGASPSGPCGPPSRAHPATP